MKRFVKTNDIEDVQLGFHITHHLSQYKHKQRGRIEMPEINLPEHTSQAKPFITTETPIHTTITNLGRAEIVNYRLQIISPPKYKEKVSTKYIYNTTVFNKTTLSLHNIQL